MNKIPLNPFPVSGHIYAIGGIVAFPDVSVFLKNVTRNEEKSQITNSLGEFTFDLANYNFGYVSGDTLELRGELGCFYKEQSLTVSGDSIQQDLTLGLDTDYMKFDLNKIKEEIIVFIRNSLEDPNNRLTLKTDAFIANGSTVKFTVSETNAKDISFITSGSTMKTNYSDYYVDYKDKSTLSKPVVYLLTPPTNGDMVEIRYLYGSSSWVYPDNPRIDLKIEDYPRIAVDITRLDISEINFGGGTNKMDGTFQITVWSSRSNELDDLVTKLKNLIVGNKKSFHYIDFITPKSIGPLIPTAERGDMISQRDFEFHFILKTESV